MRIRTRRVTMEIQIVQIIQSDREIYCNKSKDFYFLHLFFLN
jgi:hypothetical protein